METAEGSEVPDHLKSILFNITREKLAKGPLETVFLVTLREMMEFAQGIVKGIEQSSISPAVACASGCSYCCHSRINLIPVESLLIFSFIEAEFNGLARDALKRRIRENLSLTKNRTFQQRVAVKDQTPCIFLDQGRCGIYEVRPFICRSWHSFDRGACEKAFLSGNQNARIDIFPARNYVFGTAREIFQDLDAELGREGGIFAMPEAVLSCLSLGSNPLEAWLTGRQRVFLGEAE